VNREERELQHSKVNLLRELVCIGEKILAKIDDLTTALTTSIDYVGQSITDEIARVEAIIAAGGLTDAQSSALQAQIDRLTAFKATLDAERP
jgi:hypothetical protein